MLQKNSVDIVIVNWNAGNLLVKCLSSVLQESNLSYLRSCFVIDNASSDGSVEELPNDERLIIIKNQRNEGFSRACNIGFRLCEAQYVLLLNPDTEIKNNTLESCMSFMEHHEDIGILGCSLMDDSGKVSPSCARFPTPGTILNDVTGLSKFFPHVFTPGTLMTDWDHKESRIVDQVMGAFMFMRREIFSQVGYFDERFFVYFEELDFSKRFHDGGGKSYYTSAFSVTHSGGGTTNSVKAFRLFLLLRSRLQYAGKHFNLAGRIVVQLGTWCIEPFAKMVYAIISGKPGEIKGVLKGYHLLLKNKINN